MKQYRLMFLLMALCLGLCVTAQAYVDLARDATLIAPQFHEVYRPALANDGVGPADPYYWTTEAGFEANTMSVELDWTAPQTFDTVMIHFYNHAYAYNYASGGVRVYHLQQYNASTDLWEDIATANAVSDPDDVTPFAQFMLPGGVSLDKIRVQDIFDMHEIVVWDRTGNIASSATVTASYNHPDPGYDPTKCVDNDFSTMWYGGPEDLNVNNTEWTQFEWAGLQQIDSIRAYFFPHPSLIEGKVVSLQQESDPGVWTTIATSVVGREDSGFYQVADFSLAGGLVTSKLRLSNMFDMFECDIIGSPVPEPSSLLALCVAGVSLLGFSRRRTRR